MIQKVKNLFKPKNLKSVYNKIDNMKKSNDFIFINSSEGLTEEEFLSVLKNELL